MKKFLLISTVALALVSCQKIDSNSAAPAKFVIDKISQDAREKANKVCKYRVNQYTTNGGRLVYAGDRWYTLQEGFQVGDTLSFVKK